MTTTTTVGAADMDKLTIDTPEFRVLLARVQGWKHGPAVMDAPARALIAHIDAKLLPAAAPAVEMKDIGPLFKAAIDAEYPIPDSPHASVIQRAMDSRDAFWRGWNAARRIPTTAAKEAPSDVKPWREQHADGSPLPIQELMQQEIDALRALLAAPSLAAPEAWIRKTDITELTDSEPETEGWKPLYEHPAPAAPVERESKAEAVGKVHYSRHTGDYEGVIYGDVKDGDLLYTRAAHPAAPSERVTPVDPRIASQQEAQEQVEGARVRRLERERRVTPAQQAAQEGQQDQAVDVQMGNMPPTRGTDGQHDELGAMLHGTMDAQVWATEFCRLNSASDHGMMLGWFANAIMVGFDEATRRCRAQHTTIEESNSEDVRKDAGPGASHD